MEIIIDWFFVHFVFFVVKYEHVQFAGKFRYRHQAKIRRVEMKFGIRSIAVAVIMTALAADSFGETFPASISRQPLVSGRVSDRLSVGIGYDKLERGIEFDNMPEAILEADTISGYVGYDVLSWLTAFVTVGGTKVEEEARVGTDYGVKFSGGLSAYLWEADVIVPSFMSGRLSIKAMVDASRSESDTDFGTVEWFDVLAALPIGYEKFDRYPASESGLQTSLALYAGPAISYLRGTANTLFGDLDFDASEQFGVVAGADVYFSPSVSIGAKILAFDELSYGASARFHF